MSRIVSDVGQETLRGVWAILFFLLAVFTTLAPFKYAGVAGNTFYSAFTVLLGVGYFLMPILFFLLTISFIRPLEDRIGTIQWVGSLVFFVSGLGLVDLILRGKGGIVGGFITSPLIAFFDTYVSLVILVALLVISLLVVFDARLTLSFAFLRGLLGRKEQEEPEEDTAAYDEDEYEDEELEDEEEYEDEPEEEDEKEGAEEPEEERGFFGRKKKDTASAMAFRPVGSGTYTPPPLSLLEKDKGKPGSGDIKANANIIKRTLQNFGITVEIDEISIGPTVTRYALKPAEGVRLSKIVSLTNNLELALAAHPVRIEAPIPGRSLVGIEVPNSAKATVGLATILGSDEYQKSEKPLLTALGKDIAGQIHFSDVAKMPHLLIAGATGAGKSVTIHDLITSLLFRSSPEMLRFIMIDPKRVELTLYNNIPHLLTPVITDAKKCILALKWAAKEMDRRYDILETESVRDIGSYHTNVLAPALAKKNGDDEEMPEAMPYIVVVVDELADIMQAYPRELEAAVVRIAQMSRAVGIHLILSTQRPSVNVITGLIKANIPARIALQVASQIDSRTILDTGGAEKLLGSGDMLYLSGEMSKPRRIQAPFISETEVKKVVKFLVKNNEDNLPDEINLAGADKDPNALFDAAVEDEENGEEDELYEEAREIVVHAGKASTSYLQRKLRVGYARAARLMDMLEERGIIGPADGSKPREVLDPLDDGEEDEEEEQ